MGKTRLLPSHLAAVPRVADTAVKPVVQAVVQIVGLRMGVADPPAGHDLLAHVRLVIAIGVLQEQKARWLTDNHPAIGEHQPGRNVKAFGKDRELVRFAVAVGILADPDAIAAHPVRFDSVGIVAGLRDPAAATLVEGEGDRLADVRLAGKEFQPHVGRHLGALHAALHAERMLEGDRLGTTLIVGDVLVFLTNLLLARGKKGLPFLPRLVANRPHNRIAEFQLEVGVLPGAFIVTAGGVEHPALALLSNPCPRLTAVTLNTLHQQRPTLLVQLVVHRGCTPSFILVHSLHDRMSGLQNARLELPTTMGFRLAPKQLDELRGIAETRTGTVNRDEAVTALDELAECSHLRLRNVLMIGIEHHRIVSRKRLRIETIRRRIVVEVDRFTAETLHQVGQIFSRIVILTLVSKKEHPDWPRSDLNRSARYGDEWQDQQGREKGASNCRR